jgi:hypothetical protein
MSLSWRLRLIDDHKREPGRVGCTDRAGISKVGRRCKACSHMDCARIELECASGRSDRSVAEEFGLSKDAVYRRWRNHVSPARKAELIAGPLKIQRLAKKSLEEDRSLIDYLAVLRSELLHLFLSAKERGLTFDAASIVAWRPDEASDRQRKLWSSSGEPPYGSPLTALGLRSRKSSGVRDVRSAGRRPFDRASGDVRELGRDVAATDHDDPGQILKLHESIAGDGVLRTGKVGWGWARQRQLRCIERAAFH